MDGNNWRANSGQSHVPDPVMGGEAPAGDWRTQLSADSRQRIVNKIMDILTRHLPSSGQEGQQELKKIAIRFEEKTCASSTSQSDYLRKITSKMLTMETKSQNSMAISLQSNAPSNSKNPQDLASQRLQSQVPNQGQSNLNPLQPNSNVLPTQHVKQERQMFPTTQQQIKQQIQKRQILEQYMQRQQFIQQQQQQQQHHQQTNQQQSAQLSAHQMLRFQQISETNEMKMRQQMGLKSGVLQQHHSSGQRSSYHQPLKPGTPFSISSPQVLQAASPQANHALEEELQEINERLIDTVVYISDEDTDPTAVAATAKGGDGTIVKCSFSDVALSPNLKSPYASAQMSPIQSLRVLVPNNYPNCSSILLDKFPVEVRYDQAAGDPSYPIPPRLPFDKLPEDRRCPTFGASKSFFESKSVEIAGFAQNQQFGLGGNALTSGQKAVLIWGGLFLGFLFFLSGYFLH